MDVFFLWIWRGCELNARLPDSMQMLFCRSCSQQPNFGWPPLKSPKKLLFLWHLKVLHGKSTPSQWVRQTLFHTHTHTILYRCICLCVYICVYVCIFNLCIVQIEWVFIEVKYFSILILVNISLKQNFQLFVCVCIYICVYVCIFNLCIVQIECVFTEVKYFSILILVNISLKQNIDVFYLLHEFINYSPHPLISCWINLLFFVWATLW